MKKTISLALAAALAATLCACGGGSGTTQAPAAQATSAAQEGAAPAGGTQAATAAPAAPDAQATTATAPQESAGGTKVFVYGADANSTTFDPASDLQMKSGLFLVQAAGETLWTMDASGNMIPKLATSATWTDDLTLTVQLRDDVKFSNGNPFTADDVLYTLEHLFSTPRTESILGALDIAATKADGDYTVQMVFKRYDAAFIDTMGSGSFCMLDRESCEERGDFGWFIGTGPYKLAGDGKTDKSGWTESVEYHLVRNEYYWGDAPYYDELLCRFYSEESTRYSDLLAGNLDAAIFTESTYVNNLRNGAAAGSVLVQRSSAGVSGMSLAAGGGSNGSLADINIRLAIAHGMDIDSIVTDMGEGVYNVVDSVLTDSNWAYYSPGGYEYDEAKALDYLAKAGYGPSNPLTIRLVAESTAFYSAVAEAMQAYLSVIGINLDLSGMGDFPTILPRLIANDLDASLGSPSSGTGNDPAALLQQLGPVSNNGLMRLTDEELVRLFDEGSSSRDHDERVEIYRRFQQKMHDECLFIPMWTDTLNYGVSNAHASFESALNMNGFFNPCLLTD
ncbi:MAG: ABC transporter substrate-binding protein [Lachnospiraceae bacterium]|jgi:peptide/nickel transport system substrate-binding protein|nr:ABC transporter substrate-binding protein [Lachnospiraceae bacterium]